MPITLDVIVNTLEERPPPLPFQTLGRRSTFNVTNIDGFLTIINSRNREYRVTDNDVNAVCNRYDELLRLNNGSHLRAGQYVNPNWLDSPNLIFSPYIARIIHYIHSGE